MTYKFNIHLDQVRNSFNILEGVIDSQACRILKDKIYQLSDEDCRKHGIDALKKISDLGAVRDLTRCFPCTVLEEIIVLVHSILCDIIPGARLNSIDGLMLPPDSSRFPWDIHRDVPIEATCYDDREHLQSINVLFYLQDTTRSNGALRIFPQSAHTGISEEIDSDQFVDIEAKAGDMIVFDSRLLHCAGRNSSNENRVALKLRLTAQWHAPCYRFMQLGSNPIIHHLLGKNVCPFESESHLRESLISGLAAESNYAFHRRNI